MTAGAPVSVIAILDGRLVSFFRGEELAVTVMEAVPETSTRNGACALGSILLSPKVLVLASIVAKAYSFGDMVTVLPFAGAVVAVATLVGVIEGLGLGSLLLFTEVLVLAALVATASSFGDIVPLAFSPVAVLSSTAATVETILDGS